jgi:ABC-2 type transport system ATP-binding protein
MLTTLLKPDEGTVTVFGVETAVQPMLVRRLIGYVPQLLSADATLTGRENVELFARLFDVPRRVRGQQVDEALAAPRALRPSSGPGTVFSLLLPRLAR